jgi:hypothetical protein
MGEKYPRNENVFLLRNSRKVGPFSIDELLDGLESGDFTEDDICLREGETECERLRDLLDWDSQDPSDGESFGRSGFPVTESREDQLPDASALLYAGHPSILCSPIALSCLVVGLTAGAWLYPVDPTFTMAGVGIALTGLVYLSFIRFTQDYHIMPRRVEVITGLIARSSNEVRIVDIRSINVTCGGVSGLLGIGTVDFFTSGDLPEVTFRKIWAANRVKLLVRKLQDAL